MLLPEIKYEGQKQLQNSKVLIIGAGGIGSPAAYYLSGMGVGEIGIIDHDNVEESNLHRQIIHNKDRIGINKALSAKMTIERFNQRIKINAYQYQLTPQNAQELFKYYDVILDASDNPKTRYLVNDAAIINNKILISGSAIGWEGQLTVFGHNNGPCYRCLFPQCPKAGSVKSCGDAGVIGMIPGVIGLIEAIECMKIIIKATDNKVLSQRMLIFDGYEGTYKVFKVRGKQKSCIACGENPSIQNVQDFNYDEFVGSSCTVNIPQKSELFQDITWNNFIQINQKQQTQAKFIDVRPQGQFDIVNLKLFNSIPYTDMPDIKEEDYDEIFGKKDQPVYIMCRRGNNSKLACEFLYKKGYKCLYNIVGGINEYGKQFDSQIPFI
ncbi:hypothetical protein IMG5_107780 [Ichthyophthirius multifiliis]|uniref:Rhodanese domain-containing protein n=1 Tax=Ichthyophthirius multifiliis TaxID=5932 RepID=G0QTC3_ICHMU|nr:hypothetical protein IMG5_107780 [Ichthyophthirius multifiliis]EGR31558.1 hypothetical protein IMG5_107780 [Ichthyophthirius multifiliis]|eukprot:XP_004035044.1 hypothetical protein IMG5_107780 [Ichthyophthirius multifiliis]